MTINRGSSEANSGGIGFFGLLGILFIALKLTHFIHWSWLWVLAPIWGPIAFIILLLLVIGIIWLLCTIALKVLGRKSKRPSTLRKVSRAIDDYERSLRNPGDEIARRTRPRLR